MNKSVVNISIWNDLEYLPVASIKSPYPEDEDFGITDVERRLTNIKLILLQ